MEKNNKNIQYKIVKSEACGHVVEYKMIKKEHELEKARIDEGLSPREKMKAREARSSKEDRPRELSPEQYETGKKIARTKAITATGEKQRKKTLKDVLHTQRMKQKNKFPSKEDLEYPMAASEDKDCMCKDCDCDKEGTDQQVKEIKGIKYDEEHKSDKDREKFKRPIEKSEKFYIQKIQELRKAVPRYQENPADVARGQALSEQRRNQAIESRLSDKAPISPFVQERSNLARQQMANRLGVKEAPARASATGTQSNLGEYVMRNAPQGTERANQGILNNMTGFLPKQTPATANPTNTAENNKNIFPANYNKLAQQEANEMAASTKPQSFGEAFKAARAARMGGGGSDTFEFGGKKYHSFTKDDFAQGMGGKYNPAAQTPAAQTPAAQTPAAQKSSAFGKLTGKNLDQAFEQNFPRSVSRKESGPTLKTFSGGKKELTNQ